MAKLARITGAGLAAIAVIAVAVAHLYPRAPEWILRTWDDRWSRRVSHGERLVAEERWESAVTYLTALDDDFPARTVRHRRDTERERILVALSRALTELGREKRTVEVCRRAVAFAPRNFGHHFRLAEALRVDGDTAEAVGRYREVLRIHPSHQPSVKAVMAVKFAEGRFEPVAEVFDAYVDAYLVAQVRLSLGESGAARSVPVDGRIHTVRFVLPAVLASVDAELAVSNLSLLAGESPYAMEVIGLRLGAPRRVGRATPDRRLLRVDPEWGSTVRRVADRAVWLPGPEDAAPARARIASDTPVSWIEVDLRLVKPVDDEMLEMAATSYRNLLRTDRLARVRERLFPLAEAPR